MHVGTEATSLTIYNISHNDIVISISCFVHRSGPDGSMRACHAAGPVSIPGRDKFPG